MRPAPKQNSLCSISYPPEHVEALSSTRRSRRAATSERARPLTIRVFSASRHGGFGRAKGSRRLSTIPTLEWGFPPSTTDGQDRESRTRCCLKPRPARPPDERSACSSTRCSASIWSRTLPACRQAGAGLACDPFFFPFPPTKRFRTGKHRLTPDRPVGTATKIKNPGRSAGFRPVRRMPATQMTRERPLTGQPSPSVDEATHYVTRGPVEPVRPGLRPTSLVHLRGPNPAQDYLSPPVRPPEPRRGTTSERTSPTRNLHVALS